MPLTPIIVGNWKLHKTIAEGRRLAAALKETLGEGRGVEVGVAPVFTAVAAVAEELAGSSIFVSAQNCYWEDRGAFTGEVGPALLADAGCTWVIVGHSERRTLFGDTDDSVGKRARAALDAGLSVIACVGETEQERDDGHTMARVDGQLAGALAQVREQDLGKVVVAYEPVWAIGTGRTATPEQAQEVHSHLRTNLRSRYGDAGAEVRLQYGGSVKPGNAEELLAQPDIDGALVGGASLEAADFAAIVRAARLASTR